MSVVIPNHIRAFRPLRGGIGIVNPDVGHSGTLGCIATSDGVDRWLISAGHVLVPSLGFLPGRPIFQPSRGNSEKPVAQTDRYDAVLDIAAALILPGVSAAPEILGIGALQAPEAPIVGMRVVKSGIATGITEGVVTSVQADRVEIECVPGYPSKYELTNVGDSGSIWVRQGTGAPVALHVSGSDTGKEVASAVPILTVLTNLGLSIAR